MDLVLRHSWFLLKGAYYTLNITLVSMSAGLVLGLFIALARLYGARWLQLIARTYVSMMRGTPLLVKVFIVYYGLPDLGIILNPLPAAYIALTMDASAYLSEALRGSILSVNKGQMDAALSLQMSPWLAMRRVILPQAARIAIPPVGNTFIGMLKQTSLVSVITVTELLRSAQLMIAQYYVVMPFYLSVALLYWIMSSFFSHVLGRLEARLGKAY